MNPVQKIFPRYAAASTQVATHGRQAYSHAHKVVTAPTNGERLDAAVRSYDSFDHAVTASRTLPLDRVIGDTEKFYRGYAATKAAATVLVGAGVIPGARERVGRQELRAAQEHFHFGLDTYAEQGTSRYGRNRALDYTDASLEDATVGTSFLHKDLAKPLLQGLWQARQAITRKQSVPTETVQRVDDLFARAGASFSDRIAAAESSAAAAGAPEQHPLVPLPNGIVDELASVDRH